MLLRKRELRRSEFFSFGKCSLTASLNVLSHVKQKVQTFTKRRTRERLAADDARRSRHHVALAI